MTLAVAIGKFDALHRGHRALVEAARVLGEPTLLTFDRQAEVLGWSPRPPLVADVDRPRIRAAWRCAELRVDFAAVRDLTAAAFLDYLRHRGVGAVVVGADFRFGRDRHAGSAELPALAAAAGLAHAIVPELLEMGAPVSSSAVRQALAAGNVAAVSALLDRPYRLCATVVRGDGRGRALGIPTANCGDVGNQVPGSGVYAAWASLAGGPPIAAAVNAGQVPTVAGQRPFVVEAHLIGWQGDAYGQSITLDLIQRIRNEQRFAGLPDLVAQIRTDIAAVSRILDSHTIE